MIPVLGNFVLPIFRYAGTTKSRLCFQFKSTNHKATLPFPEVNLRIIVSHTRQPRVNGRFKTRCCHVEVLCWNSWYSNCWRTFESQVTSPLIKIKEFRMSQKFYNITSPTQKPQHVSATRYHLQMF